ncbi:MAG: DcuS/MalK family sensor histidine kinase [Desulfovibrio sp.]|jgi:CitB family two-component system sensor histidine kinase MalK|nr:DcuS/MalK family sensor histidine kinase [Desulfovibrio sp.]
MVSNFFNKMKLRTKLTLLIGVTFIVPFSLVSILINNFITKEYYSVYGDRAMEVAKFVATYPRIVDALTLSGSVPFEELSPFLDSLAAVAQVRYIVPMDMQAKRLYHPNHEQIGRHFVGGDEARALRGEAYISSAVGTLGFSQRAFFPVYSPEDEQVGAVSVGIMSDSIESIISKVAAPIRKMLFVTVMLGLILAVLLAKSIKKILFGLEPGEIATLLKERSTMLEIVNEGVIAIDLNGRITLVNDEARRILEKAGIKGSLLDKPLAQIVPVERLFAVMKSGVPHYGDEQTLNGVAILANYMPMTINNVAAGAISTFKDMSEVREMAEKITDINRYVDALRSQSHEFMNKLHVIMGLLNSGKQEELRSYVTQFVDTRTAEDKIIQAAVKDPVIAGFLLSKHSNARELGVSIAFACEGVLPPIPGSMVQHGLITILGNLIDNALDAVQDSTVKELSVFFAVSPELLDISIADTGNGMDAETVARIFDKGYSTKGENRGLGLWLVLRTVDELEGTIDVDSLPGAGTVFHLTLPLAGLVGETAC